MNSHYENGFDVEIRRASILTAMDHRQRWIYSVDGFPRISTDPVMNQEAVTVWFHPIVMAVFTYLADPVAEIVDSIEAVKADPELRQSVEAVCAAAGCTW